MTVEAPPTDPHIPDFQAGVSYWDRTEATVNGVLGGYGPTTAVPRLDATSSRLLILSLLPALSTIVPPHRHTAPTVAPSSPKRAYRALDCGAGIGRVTSSVLLPLFQRVDLVEPVLKFVEEAQRAAESGKEGWKALKSLQEGNGPSVGKGVRMWLAGLQHFDPARPAVALGAEGGSRLVAQLGDAELSWPNPEEGCAEADGFDLVMIQWCVGHLSDADLVAFLRRSRKALRTTETGCEGYIIVKENTCSDEAGDGVGSLFDEDDSSITRSDRVFRKVFADAGLTLIQREVQKGFPKELFPVVSYVLR